MATRKARQAILFTALLGITGLMVVIPKLSMGQANPPTTTTQSEELAEAERLNQQVDQLYTQGKYREAIPLAERALSIRKTVLKEPNLYVVESLNNLALLYYIQGRCNEVEPLYMESLTIIKRLQGEESSDVASILNNLAGLYQCQGRYSKAEQLFTQSLEMTKRLFGEKHIDVATSLNNLGGFYETIGRFTEAESLYNQALLMRKRLLGEEHPDVATSLNNLGGLYLVQGRFTEAESLYNQALLMRKRLLGEEHPNIAVSMNNLAELYKIQRRYGEAEILYFQTIEMQKKLLGKTHPDLSVTFNNLAALYECEGNINNAIKFLTQGVNIQEQNLTYNLAAGFERQKRDYLATISGTTYVTVSLHLNSALNNPKASRLAFTTILQRKGRILYILTNNLQILRQRVNDPASLKLIDELSNIYSQLASLIHNPAAQLSSNYSQQVENLEEKAKQKEDELSRRSAEFRLQSQPVSVEAIQKLIPSDAALLELVRYRPFNPKAPEKDRFGELRYAAYILNSSGEPQGIDLGEAEKIETALNSFRQDVRDKYTPVDEQLKKKSARNLDKIVMQPIRKVLGNTRKILLSPDGALNLIPFEALVDENNKYLIENYSFTYLTSGRDLLRLQTSFPSKQPPVIMADPYFERMAKVTTIQGQNRSINLSKKYFPPLPETAEEAKAIGSLLSIGLGIGIEPLIGSQASKGNLQQLKSPQILHIATHGFFESPKQEDKNTFEDNPLLLSGLVLAGFRNQQIGSNENGILTALETTSLNLLGTKLVVLSACDTGIGKDTTGEGVYGLRRALVIAGSESQVISLWKVDDNATKELMVDYYKGLVAKHGRSEALRQTQLKMLRGELGKEYQHPYYWAAFIPSGDWRPMGR